MIDTTKKKEKSHKTNNICLCLPLYVCSKEINYRKKERNERIVEKRREVKWNGFWLCTDGLCSSVWIWSQAERRREREGKTSVF